MLKKIQLRPGINTENTTLTNEGGFYDCDKVRFRSGSPEKIGGWQGLNENTYLGVARSLINWTSLISQNYLGIGTSEKYYIEYGGIYYDVTPIYSTTAFTNTITTSIGSSIVTFTDASNVVNDGDYFLLTVASDVGGITAAQMTGEFRATKTVSGSFTFTTNGTASSAVTGGGAITLNLLYPVGRATVTFSGGWGAGVWGAGTWGTPRTTTVSQQLRIWSHDSYGEDLVAAPLGGPIYYWDATTGVSARMDDLTSLSTAAGYSGAYVPTITNRVMTSGLSRFVVALGANPYTPGVPNTDFDPLLVRWSDQENPYQWVPDVTNQTGEQRLARGSQIVTGQLTRQETLIWTDTSLYSMQYTSPPNVFSFTLLIDNISIMSPQSATTANNVTYWMGVDKFYIYNGRVETLKCSVWKKVFSDLNKDQAYQVISGTNERFNEVWWFYCSADSTAIDSYVVYNYAEDIWYFGNLARTAWLDSPLRANPMAATYNSKIVYHEIGTDNAEFTTPTAISSHITTSDFDIDDGERMNFVWRILPDLSFEGSTVINPEVTMTISARYNSGSAYGSADANVAQRVSVVPIDQYTGQVYTRLRGRQMKLTMASDTLGTQWQWGTIRVDTKPDGRR